MISKPMTSMRYVHFDGAGGPDVIRTATGEAPAPGPGEVLIEVVAAGVNRPDCMQRIGVYPPPPGESSSAGARGLGAHRGARRRCRSLHVGDEVCALVGSGGYADYCVAAAALCLPVPKA